MSVKGKQREQKLNEKFVGFASVKVVAINPTRAELNKMLGKQDNEDDKEFVYLTQDQDGNDRLRMSFWLYNEKNGKYFVHSFNITNKERQNKEKTKVQLINATCVTYWAPYLEGTEDIDEDVIPTWFKNFTNKEKEAIADKKWKRALSGEEELGTLLRSWLGRMKWSDPDAEVLVDTKKLFKEDYKELSSLIDGDYDTSFVALIGVRTDDTDSTKKYQQVYGKSFLPEGFMRYIEKGNKFPSDYSKKTWNRFKDEVEGDYGFNGYTELVPLTDYDESKDISGSKATKATPLPTSGEY